MPMSTAIGRLYLRPRARGFGRNPVERLMRHANAEQLIKEICGIQPLAFSGNEEAHIWKLRHASDP